MNSTFGTLEELQAELDMLLRSCDICLSVSSSPVAMLCGHLFCGSCWNESSEVEQERTCLVCRIDLLSLGETAPAPSLRIDRILALPAPEPTPQVANSETSNGGNQGPAAGSPMGARSSPILPARMVVVQDYLQAENEDAQNFQVGLTRSVSDQRRERIRQLELLVESLTHISSALLEEVENSARERARMGSRIMALENPVVHGGTEFARYRRRDARRITPTPIVPGNNEAAPESVEGRPSTTNNSDAGT